MSTFQQSHLARHAAVIWHIPQRGKKPAAHHLCNKLLSALESANEPKYARAPRSNV